MTFSRWYDEKVSSMDLSAPLSITPTLTVDQTLEIMDKEGYDQLPVIDETGYVRVIMGHTQMTSTHFSGFWTGIYPVKVSAKRFRPGCVNAVGKLRQEW